MIVDPDGKTAVFACFPCVSIFTNIRCGTPSPWAGFIGGLVFLGGSNVTC
jgi:hypothetical protein